MGKKTSFDITILYGNVHIKGKKGKKNTNNNVEDNELIKTI